VQRYGKDGGIDWNLNVDEEKDADEDANKDDKKVPGKEDEAK
jgi:hypothetical protein